MNRSVSPNGLSVQDGVLTVTVLEFVQDYIIAVDAHGCSRHFETDLEDEKEKDASGRC